MRMLNERLQILLDGDRRRRLEHEAEARQTSVAALVREAIDLAFPSTSAERRRAGAVILEAEPMPVPAVDELRRELDELRTRGR